MKRKQRSILNRILVIYLFTYGYNYDDWFDNSNDKTLQGDKEEGKMKFDGLPCIPLPEDNKEELANLSSCHH